MKKLIYISIFLFNIYTASAQVAVIAHKGTPNIKINKTTILDFYTGDIRKWSDGNPVVVFDLKNKSDVKIEFYKFLGKSTSRMKSIWLKRMLSGEGDPPESLASEEEMLKKVEKTPGAIGFVDSSKVKGKDIKIILLIADNASDK